MAAAALASVIVSGMSFGPEKEPQTKIPGFEVSIGEPFIGLQNPYRSSLIPRISPSSFAFFGGFCPVAKITISKVSCFGSSLSSTKFTKRLLFSSSQISATLDRTNLIPILWASS